MRFIKKYIVYLEIMDRLMQDFARSFIKIFIYN